MGRKQRARARAADATRSTEGSGRYTPPAPLQARMRPTWHKVIGAVQLLLGVAIVIINYIDYDDFHILPGGHKEAYFLLGMLIAGASSWWFGAFDRQPRPEDIRREMDRQRAARTGKPSSRR